MGKSAVNMKSSHLKQLLKSCKDGVTMTIRRLPELEKEQFRQKSPKSSPRQFFPSHSPQRLPNEFPSSSSSSSSAAAVAVNYPVPGTPGSTMSDSSAGTGGMEWGHTTGGHCVYGMECRHTTGGSLYV